MPKSAICCALALSAAAPLRAQAPLTLADAFRRADSAAYANRIAGGPVELSLQDIEQLGAARRISPHHCIQGWSGVA